MNRDNKGRFRNLPKEVKVIDTDVTVLEYKNYTFSIPNELIDIIPPTALILYLEMRIQERLGNQIKNN
jgi:hypothetical protein